MQSFKGLGGGFFIMMNKLKILRDLLRFCIHVNANQKSFGVSANALPKFESGQTLMGKGSYKYGGGKG